MISSLICLLIAIAVRITVGELSKNYAFLVEWLSVLDYVTAGVAIFFVVIAVIKVIKVAIKK